MEEVLKQNYVLCFCFEGATPSRRHLRQLGKSRTEQTQASPSTSHHSFFPLCLDELPHGLHAHGGCRAAGPSPPGRRGAQTAPGQLQRTGPSTAFAPLCSPGDADFRRAMGTR